MFHIRHQFPTVFARCSGRRLNASNLKCKLSTTTPTESPSQVSKIVGIIVFSSICFGAAGLGVWQTKRYAWKIGVIEESQRKLNDIADTLPDLTQADLVHYVNKMRGRRVAVTGKFDHSKEIRLGPRSAPPGLIGAVAQGLAVNPQGYFIITPLTRNDGTTVFINRGWVSMKESSWLRPEGVLTLNTIVSDVEKMNTFSPKNDPSSMKILWIEPEALRLCLNKSDVKLNDIIVLEEFEKDEVPVTAYPAVRRQQHLNEEHVSPVTHAVYAITW